jgi:signal transduction histidine kinase
VDQLNALRGEVKVRVSRPGKRQSALPGFPAAGADNMVKINVADTGSGLPPEIRTKLSPSPPPKLG